jgi:hypothetical protein
MGDPTIMGHGEYDAAAGRLYVTQDQFDEIKKLIPAADLDPIPTGRIGAPLPSVTVVVSVQCLRCGRFRKPGEVDYNPLQVIAGQRSLGWYSGDDGEICGACMSSLMAFGNGRR